VKDAYRLAAEEKATGTILNKLCHAAFSVAKRVRTETKLTDGAISVSYAAVELARKIFSDLSSKHILLIGAGETAELAAMHLREKNATRITITNRTPEHAEALARKIGTSNIITFDYFRERLHEFDIVISAVSSVGEIVSAHTIELAMQKRRREPMLILDLGVPRNIDPSASSLYNVFLKDIDDLKLITEKNLEARRKELPKVARIVEEELIAFEQWHNTLQVAPTIRDLQAKFEAVKQQELERVRSKVSPEQYAMMEQLADRIIKKLLHFPISTLKSPIDNAQTIQSKLNLIRHIFALESSNTDQ
jgi:glutamyl-tRNA reductase